MKEYYSNDLIRFAIQNEVRSGIVESWIGTVDLKVNDAWQTVLWGVDGAEFATSSGEANATRINILQNDAAAARLILAFESDAWLAEEEIVLEAGSPFIKRRQTYTLKQSFEGALCPGFELKPETSLRYTYPLRSHEQPLDGLAPMRSGVDWALPFPFHTWHTRDYVAVYGLDKRTSAGTLDFQPLKTTGSSRLSVYYPDSSPQPFTDVFRPVEVPHQIYFEAGTRVSFEELIGGIVLEDGEDALLEALRLAGSVLLENPPRLDQLEPAAESLAAFYGHCELWKPEAFGPGRGWFLNMWTHTATGRGEQYGQYNHYYDLGWGEGVAVEMWMGAVLHWKRSGDPALLEYVDAMTPSIEHFKRGRELDALYYDRSDGQVCSDFNPGALVWTHSVGHTASQLIQLYQLAPDYPSPWIRQVWFDTALSIGRYLAGRQRPDGDLQDIFGEDDREMNLKPHRITARGVVCGLWTRLGQVSGDRTWIERALRLARFLAPEIGQYMYYNQMIDGYLKPDYELTDGEAAYYVLEGMSALYAETLDPQILALCRQAAAAGLIWNYYFDLPHAHNGIARGGQCCRMDDAPLLYAIGPAKSMQPLLSLAESSGDPIFRKMAEEAAEFISQWLIHAPGKPWDGAMVHAQSQFDGKYWGPDLEGQVDTGVSTGNSLAALERFLWKTK